jgi:hypothetical protein
MLLEEHAAAVHGRGALAGGERRAAEAFAALARDGYERRHDTDRVRSFMVLDADHLGAQATQDQCRLGPEPEPREVEHPDPGQRPRARSVHGRRTVS